jgi:hypothetical protein
VGRDAVDAGGAKDDGADLRTAKSCGPDASTPASSWRKSFPLATVANKPDRRGEHGISRKTIAQGMPGCSGEPVVTSLVCFFISHARLRVQRAPGIPCALCCRGRFTQSSGASRRENAEVCLCVIARSEATKQSILPLRGEMDCFASLAMTAQCCLKIESMLSSPA